MKMEKLTIGGAALINIIPAGFLMWTDQMQAALLILIGAVILDTITGMIKAGYCGIFKSSIAWNKGLYKFVRITIAILASYFLELIGQNGLFLYAFLINSFIYLCCFWAVLEIISIFENLVDMGLPVPTGFIKYIRRNLDKEHCKNNEEKENENK